MTAVVAAAIESTSVVHWPWLAIVFVAFFDAVYTGSIMGSPSPVNMSKEALAINLANLKNKTQ